MTTAPVLSREVVGYESPIRFMWLEITGNCQLSCSHCYAESGPTGTHGVMTTSDWMEVIKQAAALGVRMVQFIGGEPTRHPDFVQLVQYARDLDLGVEVFSNLVRITDEMWKVFGARGVRLATSYYSDDPQEHAGITGAPRSHELTTANIAQAVKRGVPLRVGIIGVREDQRVKLAQALLREIGVTNIGYDGLRQVGRGIRDAEPSTDELCGNCASGVLAVSPSGAVWPCVFSRWLPVGNVLQRPLSEILGGERLAATRQQLSAVFAARRGDDGCMPDCLPTCDPVDTVLKHDHSDAAGWCNPANACSPDKAWVITAGGKKDDKSGGDGDDNKKGDEVCVPKFEKSPPGCGPTCEPSWSHM